jgi:hypothetical protein
MHSNLAFHDLSSSTIGLGVPVMLAAIIITLIALFIPKKREKKLH